MNEYKLREATTEWLDKQSFDLFITLNTEVELTKEQMSELMCRLFYKIECDSAQVELYQMDFFSA